MKPTISPDINGRVNSANLTVSERRLEEELEIRMAHISEIALDTVLAFSSERTEGKTRFERLLGGDLGAIGEYYGSSTSHISDRAKGVLPMHLGVLELCAGLADECDRAYYSSRLVAHLTDACGETLSIEDFFFGDTVVSDGDSKPLLRYVGNSETETAIGELVSCDSVELSRADSIEDCCRETAEEGGFAVLPMRNRRDGVLRLFVNLISRYEVRICTACRIEKNDGADYTDFVLITSKNESTNKIAKKSDGRGRFSVTLRLRGDRCEYYSITRISAAASVVGASVVSVEHSTSGAKEAIVQISSDGDALIGLLAYVMLFLDGADSLVGVYGEIE